MVFGGFIVVVLIASAIAAAVNGGKKRTPRTLTTATTTTVHNVVFTAPPRDYSDPWSAGVEETRRRIAEQQAEAQRRATTPGPDLDCDDIIFAVDVSGGDPHHLDGDGDGWGCGNAPPDD